jgi:malonate transporter
VPNYAGGLPLIAAVFGPTDTFFVAVAIATASIVLSPLTLAILEFNNAAANGQQNFGVVLGGATAL